MSAQYKSMLQTSNNKQIAKNTLVLYVRTLFTMVVALFTSRVVLNALGVDNYGIYNVVAGFVSMLAILSGSLSTSISRFITYELGRGRTDKLIRIFSTSVVIQIGIAALIIIIGEIVGLWFVNTYLNIPSERLIAANWVYQCSLFVFAFNILYVPYNACIIAHEKMNIFAYVSILDVLLKLAIAYSIQYATADKLIMYALLLLAQSILITFIYMIYSKKTFSECKFQFILDREVIKNMTGFAGWSFLTCSAAVLNTQGLNVLINLFFNISLNAARGIASQVEAVIMRFVNDFTTAINPQITKNYAAGEKDAMNVLICRGAKFSYLLLLCLSFPFMYETNLLLKLWLGIVPEHTVAFFRLTMVASIINILGNTGVTACMATGKIKAYTITLTSIGLLVFPLTWLAYKLGAPAEFCYIIYILIYFIILFVRLGLMKKLFDFPITLYMKTVLLPVFVVTLIAFVVTFIAYFLMQESLIRLLCNAFLSIITIVMCSYKIALTKSERATITNVCIKYIRK